MNRRPPLSAVQIPSTLSMVNLHGVGRLRCRNTLTYQSWSRAELGRIDVFNQAFLWRMYWIHPRCGQIVPPFAPSEMGKAPTKGPCGYREIVPRTVGRQGTSVPRIRNHSQILNTCTIRVSKLPRVSGCFTRYNDNAVLRSSCTCDRSADTRDGQAKIPVPNPKPVPLSWLRIHRQFPGTWTARSN